MTDYATMSAGAELDRVIAEKVMGWEFHHDVPGYGDCWLSAEFYASESPSPVSRVLQIVDEFNPSTNASDDYRVLEHVRETWTMERRNAVGVKFAEIQTDRNFERLEKSEGLNESVADWHPWWLEHHPGDWSRAALAVLAEEDNDD